MFKKFMNTLNLKLNRLNTASLMSYLKGKHHVRIEFYLNLLDFLEYNRDKPINTFFSWYLEKMKGRREKSHILIKFLRKRFNMSFTSKTELIVQRCFKKMSVGAEFKLIIKDWLPEDEFLVLDANLSPRYNETFEALVEMAKDRISTSNALKNSIFGSLFLSLALLAGTIVLLTFVYTSFLSGSVIQGIVPTGRDLNLLEQRYFSWLWFSNNIIYLGISAVIVTLWIKHLLPNWAQRWRPFRLYVVDYIPPFSIYKKVIQYNIALILYHYLRTGSKWVEALTKIEARSKPYAKKIVSEINQRSVGMNPNVAFNVYFMGESGDKIEDRGEGRQIEAVLGTSLPELQALKNSTIEKSIKITTKLVIIPTLGFLFIYVAYPVVFYLMDIIKEAKG
ncbi:MAG: hypothetical protein HAW67_03795 [Endozoicomonadaceae bacterium]|nr:hypothetical protein [Endozoicomonadaceae bacterium]